jgi:manganese/zinc/iron transport system substrate-binding protein
MLIGLMLLGMASCNPAGSAGSSDDRRPAVVSTVGMLDDIVRNVAGDRIASRALMGPGTDPHLYRPTAQDVRVLEGSDLLLYVGLELEGRMAEILPKMERGGRRVLAAGKAVPQDQLMSPADLDGRYDPHIWMDPTLWRFPVEAVVRELKALDGDGSDAYRAAADAYFEKLDELDRYAQERMAEIPRERRVLITAHDAFGYFGRRYDVEVIGIQGISTAAEASAADIRRLADLIADRRLPAIFIEASVPPSTIQALREAVRSRGWNVKIGGELYSDSLGAAGSPTGTYEGMFRHNVDTIAEALR